ncbi:MAG: hypothetical protein FWD57_14870 [Polyangiaceae bacterium]|nr:hypothetical protein [Polyangiaceae bacterium]
MVLGAAGEIPSGTPSAALPSAYCSASEAVFAAVFGVWGVGPFGRLFHAEAGVEAVTR